MCVCDRRLSLLGHYMDKTSCSHGTCSHRGWILGLSWMIKDWKRFASRPSLCMSQGLFSTALLKRRGYACCQGAHVHWPSGPGLIGITMR